MHTKPLNFGSCKCKTFKFLFRKILVIGFTLIWGEERSHFWFYFLIHTYSALSFFSFLLNFLPWIFSLPFICCQLRFSPYFSKQQKTLTCPAVSDPQHFKCNLLVSVHVTQTSVLLSFSVGDRLHCSLRLESSGSGLQEAHLSTSSIASITLLDCHWDKDGLFSVVPCGCHRLRHHSCLWCLCPQAEGIFLMWKQY